MKTLYLHIGMPKTATSSLQKFLELNQEALKSYNYSYCISPLKYPKVSRLRNAHFLSGPEPTEELDEESSRQYQDRLNSGLDFVKNQFAAYDNVILTDESLWYSINYSQWDPLQILTDHAKENNYQIRIIVYLRRQDKFEISRSNQRAKFRNSNKSFGSFIQYDLTNKPKILYYDQTLDHIADKIGGENLIVRRFEASSWPEGSVYRDFQKALQLSDKISLKYPKKNANQSLKNNYLDLKLRINHNLYLNDDQKDLFTKYIEKASDSREEHDDYGLMTSDETLQFLSLFEKGNAHVAREYIRDGKPLFSDPIKDVKKWFPENEYMLDDVNFFLSLLPEEMRTLYYLATLLDLQTRVRDLQEQNSAQEYTLQELRKIRHPIRTISEKFSGDTDKSE